MTTARTLRTRCARCIVSLAGPGILTLLALAGPVAAQDEAGGGDPAIDWVEGPAVGTLGDLAEIRIPEGFRFTGAEGARRLMELMENPTSGKEFGFITPADEEAGWFVVFEFSDIGYVKDDEKDNLDADAILKSIREGTGQANKVRKEKGWATLEITGWQKPPFYNARTNNLEWAILGSTTHGGVVNYSTRILGRKGVMHADLVLQPDRLAAAAPAYEDLLKGFTYSTGARYGEFRAGDKVAKYGLTALVAGGAGAALAKSGLLAKFWKLIVAGVVAVAAAARRFFRKVTGEDTISQAPAPPTEG